LLSLKHLSSNPFPFQVPKLDWSIEVVNHPTHIYENHGKSQSDKAMTNVKLHHRIMTQVNEIRKAEQMETQ